MLVPIKHCYTGWFVDQIAFSSQVNLNEVFVLCFVSNSVLLLVDFRPNSPQVFVVGSRWHAIVRLLIFDAVTVKL